MKISAMSDRVFVIDIVFTSCASSITVDKLIWSQITSSLEQVVAGR